MLKVGILMAHINSAMPFDLVTYHRWNDQLTRASGVYHSRLNMMSRSLSVWYDMDPANVEGPPFTPPERLPQACFSDLLKSAGYAVCSVWRERHLPRER